jgi:hypothetical protein
MAAKVKHRNVRPVERPFLVHVSRQAVAGDC